MFSNMAILGLRRAAFRRDRRSVSTETMEFSLLPSSEPGFQGKPLWHQEQWCSATPSLSCKIKMEVPWRCTTEQDQRSSDKETVRSVITFPKHENLDIMPCHKKQSTYNLVRIQDYFSKLLPNKISTQTKHFKWLTQYSFKQGIGLNENSSQKNHFCAHCKYQPQENHLRLFADCSFNMEASSRPQTRSVIILKEKALARWE